MRKIYNSGGRDVAEYMKTYAAEADAIAKTITGDFGSLARLVACGIRVLGELTLVLDDIDTRIARLTDDDGNLCVRNTGDE